MNYNDEEVQLITDWNDARKAFVAAKAARSADPEAYAEAKAAMTELRTNWREIRQATYVAPQDADADGTASPVVLSAPATPQEIAQATKEGS